MKITDMFSQEVTETIEQVVDTLIVDALAKGLIHAKHNLNEMSLAMEESLQELYPDNKVLSSRVNHTQRNIEKEFLRRVKSMTGSDQFSRIVELAESYNKSIVEGDDNAD